MRIDSMWEKISQMCLAQTFISSERMLTLTSFVLDHFHFALAMPSKMISPQEFTQTFALMTFRAQRAKFWLVGFRSGGLNSTPHVIHEAS